MSDGAKPPEPGVEPTFRKIFDDHARFIWRSLLGLGVAEADVPDASQQVFVVLHDRLGDLAKGCPLRTFVYGICLRVASDFRRRAHRRRERLCAESPERSTETTPEGLAADREALAALETALDRLPPPQREVFVLYENRRAPDGRDRARSRLSPADRLLAAARRAKHRGRNLGRASEPNGGLEVKDVNGPERLLSAAARGSRLERGLRMARGRRPTDAELSALRAGLFGGAAGAGALLERSARAGAKPGTTAGSSGWRALGLTKAATALVVASTVAGGAALSWHRTQPIEPERRAPPASLVKGNEAPHVVPLAPAAIPTPVASARRRSSTVAAATRSLAVAPVVSSEPIAPSAPPASEVDVDEELLLLGEAQRALPKEPELALAFVRDHERRYPNGLLSQEREAVAVSALWQVGRRDEARRRAERFAEEHPRSTYVGRMRHILALPSDRNPTDKDDDVPPSTVGGRR